MEILIWVIFGAIVGWIANLIMGGNNGLLGDMILGIVGALIGGSLMNMIGQPGVTGFNVYSVVVAVLGSVVVLYIVRLFTNNRRAV